MSRPANICITVHGNNYEFVKFELSIINNKNQFPREEQLCTYN